MAGLGPSAGVGGTEPLKKKNMWKFGTLMPPCIQRLQRQLEALQVARHYRVHHIGHTALKLAAHVDILIDSHNMREDRTPRCMKDFLGNPEGVLKALIHQTTTQHEITLIRVTALIKHIIQLLGFCTGTQVGGMTDWQTFQLQSAPQDLPHNLVDPIALADNLGRAHKLFPTIGFSNSQTSLLQKLMRDPVTTMYGVSA